MVLTDLHGEIIVKEAIDPTRSTFDYDTQEFAYRRSSACWTAIEDLQRTDGAVDQPYLGKTDKIYNGDRTKWLKLAYGLLAMNLNHYSNKSHYKPADVIAAVDKSFASNADDALLAYPRRTIDDYNFWGRTRNNITNYRQTQFVVGLMNGTAVRRRRPAHEPHARAVARRPVPRPRHQRVGLRRADRGAAAEQLLRLRRHGRPRLPGRYLFDDKSKMPVMTYAELQFIKAEAAYRSGDKATALAAYRNAISAHIDFVNARNTDNGQSPTQITAAEKTAFLAIGDRAGERGAADAHADHVAEVHRAVGLGTQRAVDGHAPVSLHGRRSGERAAGVSRASRRRPPVSRQRRQDRAADPAAVQLGVRVEHRRPGRHRRDRAGLPHEADVDHSTVTAMTQYRSHRRCSVPRRSPPATRTPCRTSRGRSPARVRFFNFGVNAPGVNFYANDTEVTAISATELLSRRTTPRRVCNTTGAESTTGVAYGGAGIGGLYTRSRRDSTR